MAQSRVWTIAACALAGALVLVSAGVAPVLADRGRFGERIGNYHFRVEIDGVDVGRFEATDGLSIEQEIIEFRDGSDPNLVRKVPGEVRYGNLTLKRGVVSGDFLWEWVRMSFDPDGDVLRKDGDLILMDPRGREVVRYRFVNAWPAKWEGPSFDAEGTEVAIEEIVLAVESFEEMPPDDTR